MQFIFIEKEADSVNGGQDLLADVCRSRPAGEFLLDGLRGRLSCSSGRRAAMALPVGWREFVGYSDCFYDDQPGWHAKAALGRNDYVLLTNGRYATDVDWDWLEELVQAAGRDVISFSVEPAFRAFEELVRFTPENQVVGFSRLYSDTAEPSTPPEHWPHHIFVRRDIWLARGGAISLDAPFGRFLDNFDSCIHLNVAGNVLDLQKEQDLLFFLSGLNIWPQKRAKPNGSIAPSARLYGPLLLGKDIRIGPDAVVVGPAILCDGVQIGGGSVVRNAILGQNVSVRKEQILSDSIVLDDKSLKNSNGGFRKEYIVPSAFFAAGAAPVGPYRHWPGFSYALFGKRLFDIIFSAVVLLLFLPVFPLIILAIKLTSKGPVFYEARRQGRHGKHFDCLKFRTMVASADTIQNRLRAVNQVDGPQFKIENDPRISGVGRFLRDTCIDEIPQFINVLMGDMSVVGPRPSPEEENQACPAWRDARLSVRPGITGLWQISRTRQASMDFQEWVYYDMEYVRRLSLWTDVLICLRTGQKLINLFLSQFG